MFGQQSCPKCKGRILYIDRDLYGWFVQCLMCGFSHDLEELDTSQDNSVEFELKSSQNEVGNSLPDSRSKYA
jgi:hypothetical protein